MPLKLDLGLMTVVGTNGLNSEWEFLDYVVYKIYGADFIVMLIDFQGSNTCAIIDTVYWKRLIRFVMV